MITDQHPQKPLEVQTATIRGGSGRFGASSLASYRFGQHHVTIMHNMFNTFGTFLDSKFNNNTNQCAAAVAGRKHNNVEQRQKKMCSMIVRSVSAGGISDVIASARSITFSDAFSVNVAH
ncbi:hypothetical protein GPALN_014856 [Globodera pallida]|nr:hypothetical protein GPALN_014856 [Globodera pallida]